MSIAELAVAVTMGDPGGIGPEIILKSWKLLPAHERGKMLVLGCPQYFQALAKSRALDIRIDEVDHWQAGNADGLQVFPVSQTLEGAAGNPHPADAGATIAAIEKAVGMVFDRQASAIVTAPINKAALYSAGFSHPGHTEFLAALAEKHTGKSHLPVMMLAGPQLRTVPVTIHIPLQKVPDHLTELLIMDTVRIVDRDLKSGFGIENPKIAIAGLNPHAGEEGALGTEEIDIVTPAIARLKAEGLAVTGPLPADTMFHEKARSKYDVAVCMYHDQALIPAKMLGFHDAVNVTLGLPFIRTSPDHGTAYDIAGTGTADPSSFIAAFRMASEMAALQTVTHS